MATKALPSIETLRKLLAYDPATGVLTWLPRPPSMFSDGGGGAASNAAAWNARFAWAAAGGGNGKGYVRIGIRGSHFKAHRVAWALHHGEWPAGQIDHINGDPADNRITNLRVATNAENNRNRKCPANNSSGAIGIDWSRSTEKWRARIKVRGQTKHIGLFDDFSAAVAARKSAEVEFGFHPHHGRL